MGLLLNAGVFRGRTLPWGQGLAVGDDGQLEPAVRQRRDGDAVGRGNADAGQCQRRGGAELVRFCMKSNDRVARGRMGALPKQE